MAFESVKPILDFMGLILVPGTTNTRTHYIKNVLFTVPMLLLLCSLGAYFLVNLSNLMKATEVFYVIAATLLCIGQYWFLVSQKESLWLVLINLQKLVDHRDRGSKQMFIDVEHKILIFTRQMKGFVSTSSTSCLILPILYAAYRYALGIYTPHDWYLPYQVTMPFDVSTLSMGYIIAYSIQLSGSAIICAIIYTINSLFFGICWYIRVLLLDLQQTFSRINKLYTSDGRSMGYKTYAAKRPFKRTNNNKIKSLQSNGTEIRSFANPTDPAELAHINHVTKLIKNFVEDHNDILRFANNFGDLATGMIFVTFVLSISWICTSFFQIHSYMQSFSYLLLQSIMTTIAIILIIYIFCYFGHMVTTDCADVADFIYDAAWYRYPIFVQRSILFIIGRAHLPFYFTAYKMYKCTLQSFTGIISTGFQVFMLFRSMNSETA